MSDVPPDAPETPSPFDAAGRQGTAPPPGAPPPAPREWRPHPRCTSCGYELVGLRVEDLCPECGATVWGSNRVPPTSGYAIASLVLGIVAVVSCLGVGPFALIPGVLAVVFGEMASGQYKRGVRAGGTYGMALAGRICGWIGIVLSLVFALIFIAPMLGWW